jgi:competence protein ComFC
MLSRLWKLVRNLKSILADILFPESCAGCGKKDTPLCSPCMRRIAYYSETAEEPWIFPVALYTDTAIHRSITRAKYNNRPEALIYFGKALFDRLLEVTTDETILTPRPWILVPIPLSTERLRTRGYNQATILAKASKNFDTANVFQISEVFLFRKPGTKSQVAQTSRAIRLTNPRNTFFIKNSEAILNSRIILIDDVVTTGATLREARRMLTAAGAKEVLAVPLAYTERR